MHLLNLARRAFIPMCICVMASAEAPRWRQVAESSGNSCFMQEGSARPSKRGVKATVKVVFATPLDLDPSRPKIAYMVESKEFSKTQVWSSQILSYDATGKLVRKITNPPSEPAHDIQPGSFVDLQSQAAFQMVETEKSRSKAKR